MFIKVLTILTKHSVSILELNEQLYLEHWKYVHHLTFEQTYKLIAQLYTSYKNCFYFYKQFKGSIDVKTVFHDKVI